jgi:hypothetical protein
MLLMEMRMTCELEMKMWMWKGTVNWYQRAFLKMTVVINKVIIW